jgi:hypothetical protein
MKPPNKTKGRGWDRGLEYHKELHESTHRTVAVRDVASPDPRREQQPFASVEGSVAEYMRSQPRWLVHRGKRPLAPNLRPCNANDSHNFLSFANACAVAWHVPQGGIGYALASDPRLVVFDFDHVLDAAGALTNPLLETMLSRLPAATAYIEASLSGLGLHVCCLVSPEAKRLIASHVPTWTAFMSKADSDAFAARTGRADDMTRHAVFVGGGYVTVTGKVFQLARNAPHDIDDNVLEWFHHRFGPGAVRRSTGGAQELDLDDDVTYFAVVACLDAIDASDRDRWIKVGHILHRLSRGGPRGLELWDKWSRTTPDKYPKRGEASTARLYRGFRPNGTLGFGSLVLWANEGQHKSKSDIHGWEAIEWAR